MQTVVGVFDSYEDAEDARDSLIESGFSEDAVRVQSHSSLDGVDDSDTGSVRSQSGDRDEGGVMSSIGHFFRDLFGGEDEHAGHYSEAVRRGSTVVAVTVSDPSQVEGARSALAAAGAVDIDKRAEGWREEGYQGFDPSARPFRQDEIQAERARSLPVVREDIDIDKREVNLGAVRVHTRMETRPVEEQVQLREQHAEIERRPVDRPVTQGDLDAFKEGTIEVQETAERPVVNKTARVVEEVSVGLHDSTRTETVRDEVRNTVVDVERDRDTGRMGSSTGDRAAPGMRASGSDFSDDGDTPDYRAHYDSVLSSEGRPYEDFEPAYQYGSSLRSDERYASASSWDDIEPRAQQDWAGRNPGGNWERSKQAVRHGWESMTGRR